VAAQRVKIHVQGAVQGVGFRPFIYRLAHDFSLNGWVKNSPNGVFIEAEGDVSQLHSFVHNIEQQKPNHSIIHSLKHHFVDSVGFENFRVIESDSGGDTNAWILPDIATCPKCLNELLDPTNRRYLYPFTNCTHCGPRFTIIEKLPYDRQNTTMKSFEMCADCQAEYENPEDRRFHAQPNACPECGPRVELTDAVGVPLSQSQDAIEQTIALFKEGKIVAVKGLGGFHIMCDPNNSMAVEQLRQRKNRDEKPFALMFPDPAQIESCCLVSEEERRLLTSNESPIVLLQKRENISDFFHDLLENAAPKNPQLGVMLPYTPLHHIILRLFDAPLVATSGNLSDESICTLNNDAVRRLGIIVDFFLLHNRDVARHADDSIARIIAGRPVLLRRARGYAPLPISLQTDGPNAIAVGGHLKNTIAVNKNKQVFISQHIGDLDTESSLNSFDRTIADFKTMYKTTPQTIVHDAHPDYMSTKTALEMTGEKVALQHHLAHIYSCMADNELEPPILGVSWDGTGYGDDGTIWGGEFFLIEPTRARRIAHLRTFPLPGGDSAIKQPFRTALGLLYELTGGNVATFKNLPPFQMMSRSEEASLLQMLHKDINCPRTSSIGRLFDAVASLLDLQHYNRYEGQAPMQLEFAALKAQHIQKSYPINIKLAHDKASMCILDWQPMINTIISDILQNVDRNKIATTFHNSLAQMILVAAENSGQNRVVLSGGAFQNKLLVEKTIDLLSQHDFQVYTHQRVPPNDGGISLGQIAALGYLQSS
jgi:hydrogenase maturation protein HypF